jgi:hypothetical protein
MKAVTMDRGDQLSQMVTSKPKRATLRLRKRAAMPAAALAPGAAPKGRATLRLRGTRG